LTKLLLQSDAIDPQETAMRKMRSYVEPVLQLPWYGLIPRDDAWIGESCAEEGGNNDPFQDGLHTTTEGISGMGELWRECPRQHKVRVVGTWDHQHYHRAAHIGPLPRCKAAATAYCRFALIPLASQVLLEALLRAKDANWTQRSWRMPYGNNLIRTKSGRTILQISTHPSNGHHHRASPKAHLAVSEGEIRTKPHECVPQLLSILCLQ